MGKRSTFQTSTQQIDRLIIEILITYAHAIHILVLIPVLIKLIVQIVLITLIEIITKQIARFNNTIALSAEMDRFMQYRRQIVRYST